MLHGRVVYVVWGCGDGSNGEGGVMVGVVKVGVMMCVHTRACAHALPTCGVHICGNECGSQRFMLNFFC